MSSPKREKKKNKQETNKSIYDSAIYRIPLLPTRIATTTRTILIFTMFSLSLFVEMRAEYNTKFPLYLVVQLLIMLAVSLVLSKNTYPCKVVSGQFDIPAVTSCTCFAFYTLISDIMVDKLYRFSGVSVFLTLLVFACIWNTRRDNALQMRDIERATQWFLLFLVALSVITRNTTDDGRFSGPILNPSIYALYLCSIWAVLIGSLEYQFNNRINKAKLVLTLVELLVTLSLVILSQSLTPLISVIAVSCIWLFRHFGRNKGKRKHNKYFAIIIIIGIIVFFAIQMIFNHTGPNIGTRLYDKMLSGDITSLLSGRDYYWRAYLRKMNLFGHGKAPILWDHHILPHNAIIGMAYTYGVPCIVPYIIMMVIAVEKSYYYSKQNTDYSSIPFYSIIAFIIMSLADNVEQPFVWMPWIVCYMTMAPLLLMPIIEGDNKSC